MTDTDHMIAVMQAAKEGKTIQCKFRAQGKDHWFDVAFPSWDWATFDYRIKPKEPRRIWVNMYDDHRGFAYPSREQANARAGTYRAACVEFVEVVK